MLDLGPLRYFLGIEISSTPEGFYLSQEKYIKDLLDRASLIDDHTIVSPWTHNIDILFGVLSILVSLVPTFRTQYIF